MFEKRPSNSPEKPDNKVENQDLPEKDRRMLMNLLHLVDRYVINTNESAHGRAMNLRLDLEEKGQLSPELDRRLMGIGDASINFETDVCELLSKHFGLTDDAWDSLRQEERMQPLQRFKSIHDQEQEGVRDEE